MDETTMHTEQMLQIVLARLVDVQAGPDADHATANAVLCVAQAVQWLRIRRETHAAKNLEQYPGLQGNVTPVDCRALTGTQCASETQQDEAGTIEHTQLSMFEKAGERRCVTGVARAAT